jgi:hypothetical protein
MQLLTINDKDNTSSLFMVVRGDHALARNRNVAIQIPHACYSWRTVSTGIFSSRRRTLNTQAHYRDRAYVLSKAKATVEHDGCTSTLYAGPRNDGGTRHSLTDVGAATGGSVWYVLRSPSANKCGEPA